MGANNGHSNGNGREDRPSDRDLEIYHRCKIAGERQREVARDYDITQGRVAQIIVIVEAWTLKHFKADVEAIKAEQTQQLAYLANEALEAWRRSQRNAVSTKETKKPPQSDVDTELEDGSPAEGEIEITTKGQSGDPRFLEQARGAYADIRKIWGAEAPAKVESTNHNFNHNFQTREQLAEQLVKLRQTLVPKEN